VALRLKRNGITRIRPLAGGLNLWVTREFPIEELKPAPDATGPGPAFEPLRRNR
jgi:hypothetical protein